MLGDLCAKVPDFATLEALFEPFGFLVAEVRTVAELAETAWASEREVFTEVEPGAGGPSARSAPTRAPSARAARAPRFAEHTRAVLPERLHLADDSARRAGGRRRDRHA